MNPPSFLAPLQAAAERMRREPWFKAGNWTVVVTRGQWAGLQLSKPHWFNGEGHGIHFETWVDQKVLESGIIQFQCHVMHAGMTFPGTEKKAAALSRPVMARHRDEVKAWGYHVPSTGGMGLLSARIPFTAGTLEETIVAECRRFSLLGATIDEVLEHVLAGKRPPAAARKPEVEAAADARKDAPGQAEQQTLLPSWNDSGQPGSAWSGLAFPKVGIVVTTEADGLLRVDVTGNPSKNHHAILQCAGIPLLKGQRYRVSYEVRAETSRWMTGNIRQPLPPHNNLGDFKGRTLTPEWQRVEWEFTASADEPEAQLWFALGKVPNVIYFREIILAPVGVPPGA